jgi:hypothetical protein
MQEIADHRARMPGEVREAIVFVEKPATAAPGGTPAAEAELPCRIATRPRTSLAGDSQP